jgi:hypothetical protein
MTLPPAARRTRRARSRRSPPAPPAPARRTRGQQRPWTAAAKFGLRGVLVLQLHAAAAEPLEVPFTYHPRPTATGTALGWLRGRKLPPSGLLPGPRRRRALHVESPGSTTVHGMHAAALVANPAVARNTSILHAVPQWQRAAACVSCATWRESIALAITRPTAVAHLALARPSPLVCSYCCCSCSLTPLQWHHHVVARAHVLMFQPQHLGASYRATV